MYPRQPLRDCRSQATALQRSVRLQIYTLFPGLPARAGACFRCRPSRAKTALPARRFSVAPPPGHPPHAVYPAARPVFLPRTRPPDAARCLPLYWVDSLKCETPITTNSKLLAGGDSNIHFKRGASSLRTCSRSYCAPVSLRRAVLGILTYIKYAPVPVLRPPWLTGARDRSCTGSYLRRCCAASAASASINGAESFTQAMRWYAPPPARRKTARARISSSSSVSRQSAVKPGQNTSTRRVFAVPSRSSNAAVVGCSQRARPKRD